MEELIEMFNKIDARIKEINEILKGKQNEIKRRWNNGIKI